MIEILVVLVPSIVMGMLGVLESNKLGVIICLSLSYVFVCLLQRRLTLESPKVNQDKSEEDKNGTKKN